MTEGRDAAFAVNLEGTPIDEVIGGYLFSLNAYHPWSVQDWGKFPQNRKLPYFVPETDGAKDGRSVLEQLRALGVPGNGSHVAIDMEQRKDDTYLNALFEVVRPAGYRVLVYSSFDLRSGLVYFDNPALNGYIVALYDGDDSIPATWPRSVRGKQYANDVPPGYDKNIFRDWVAKDFWL